MATAIYNLFTLKKESVKILEDAVNQLKAINAEPADMQIVEETCKAIEQSIPMLLYDANNADFYMSIAKLAALRSKDPRTPVGACIVDANRRVVGIGYNSMPYTKSRDVDNDDNDVFTWSKKELEIQLSASACGSDKKIKHSKNSYVCHAAVNAIVNRTISDLTNCTMYLTLCPDEDCAHLVALSGIKEVKYQRNVTRGNVQYEKNARAIFALQGVSIKEFNPKTDVTLTITREMNAIGQVIDELFRLLNDSVSLLKIVNGETVLQEQTELLILLMAVQPVKPLLTFNLQERMESKDIETNPIDICKADRDHALLWDEFFMGLALLEKIYNNDSDKVPSAKVGACLVSPSKQVIAIGGSETGDPKTLGERGGSQNNSLPGRDLFAQHAEYKMIATYKGTLSIKGCTLYVTLSPCNVCAKLIAQSGIEEVVYKDKYMDKSAELGERIFKNCSIECRKFINDDIDLKIDKTKDCTLFKCTRLSAPNRSGWSYCSLRQLLPESNDDPDAVKHLKDTYKFSLKSVHISLPNDTPANAIKVLDSSGLCETDEANYMAQQDQINRKFYELTSTAQVINIDRPICEVNENMAVRGHKVDGKKAVTYTLMEDITICFGIMIENK